MKKVIDEDLIDSCKKSSDYIRHQIIEMTYATGRIGAHLGGSLSMAEMLGTLYTGVLRYRPNEPDWDERDRVIFSKGHGALALYPALARAGIIDSELLKTFKQNGSKLGGHPSLNGLPGIEFASGSLGQGLSLGVGVCLALKRKNYINLPKVFVFLGDGECDEGSVWEAVASASHYGLNNLIAVIDTNHIQYDGETNKILNMSPMDKKWESFGWKTKVIDGHDIEQLLNAYNMEPDKPLVIIADTIKGKGVSFMEGNWKYHNSVLTKEQYEKALRELEGPAC